MEEVSPQSLFPLKIVSGISILLFLHKNFKPKFLYLWKGNAMTYMPKVKICSVMLMKRNSPATSVTVSAEITYTEDNQVGRKS